MTHEDLIRMDWYSRGDWMKANVWRRGIATWFVESKPDEPGKWLWNCKMCNTPKVKLEDIEKVLRHLSRKKHYESLTLQQLGGNDGDTR